MSVEKLAEDYARNKHAGMLYDNKDFFETHVMLVVKILKKYTYCQYEIAAAYLHDVVEDTDATIEEVNSIFGADISDIVYRVTDKEGSNRRQRHLNTYYILRQNPSAVRVKLADRIANMTRAIGTKYAKMYAQEYYNFKFALYDGENPDMWKELDHLYVKCSA
jgi:(p)ppGpp synthase/HD superfamily hydrolase